MNTIVSLTQQRTRRRHVALECGAFALSCCFSEYDDLETRVHKSIESIFFRCLE